MVCPAACTGGQIKCTFGVAPAAFSALANTNVTIGGLPVGNITHKTPNQNIPSMGLCLSVVNPQFEMILGVPKYAACMPNVIWISSSPTVTVSGQAILTEQAIGMCTNGMGSLAFVNAGQANVEA